MMIHRCDWSDNVSIRIACDRSWTEPNLSIDGSGEDGREVFVAIDGRLYTFDAAQVTCEACKP